MATKSAKPKDLGNDHMFIRTKGELMTDAGIRSHFDMKLKGDRAILRRFAERILAMCDYWENRL